MRNIKYTLLIIIMALSVFMISGCGGSLNDGSETQEEEAETPQNLTAMLNGRWTAVEDQTFSLTINDSEVAMNLITASLTFSNTQVSGDSGVSTVTSYSRWHAVQDETIYLGIHDIDINDTLISLTRNASNDWRGECYDADRTTLNIQLTSGDTMTMIQHGIASFDSSALMNYEFTINMRKQQ